MKGRAVLLDKDFLSTMIQVNKLGVYILGKHTDRTFYPFYVGRSDTCLLRRLLSHNHWHKASHVEWELVENAQQGFIKECCLFHTYEDENFLNQIHPASPQGLNLACPVCSFVDLDVSNIPLERKKVIP